MNRLEERVADQLNEKALDVMTRAVMKRRGVIPEAQWIAAVTGGYAEDQKAALSALESQGLKIVPVELTYETASQPTKTGGPSLFLIAHYAEGQAESEEHVMRVLNDAYTAMLNAVEG